MKKMAREEREALSGRICNFYYDSTKKFVNCFRKQNVPKYDILCIKKVLTI